jgi:signal transduction histidine kinase
VSIRARSAGEAATLTSGAKELTPSSSSLRTLEVATMQATPTRTSTAHPARHGPPHDLHDELVSAVATAESVPRAISAIGALLLRHGVVSGIEWWTTPDGGGSYHCELLAGEPKGARSRVELGPLGRLVLIGESAAGLVPTLAMLRPLFRLRCSEVQLAEHASRLARKTEALDDFAALVAHDVKSSLIGALRDEDPREGLTHALELVDSILEAVRTEQRGTGVAELEGCVQHAIADLGDTHADIVVSVTGDFPIPPDALRLILRNLLANAIAAGAGRIHVSSLVRGERRVLVIDDDGVGLASASRYATGGQLGLSLCRRIVERYGGVLELRPRAVRGARAIVAMKGQP